MNSDRWTDRQTDIQQDRQIGVEALLFQRLYILTDSQTDGLTNRPTNGQSG